MSPISPSLIRLKSSCARVAVAAHQADADLEALLLRLLAQGHHPAGRRPIDGDRLLHEGIDSLLDGVGEVHPAEGRRGGQDHHVARLEAVHGLLVAVEADELAILGHVDLVAVGLLQLVVAVVEPILEHVGHGHELDRALAWCLRALPTAPVPRPPQPTSATRMVLSEAACTDGTITPARAEAVADRARRLEEVAPRRAGCSNQS